MNPIDLRNSIRKTTTIHPYGRNPKRYLIGTIYCFQFMVQGLSANPLTPAALTVANAYNVDITYVNYSSSIWFFSSVIMSFPAIFLINKFSLTFAVKYALFMFVCGFGLRLLIGYTIWSVLIGQLICGAASPIVANIQVRIIAEWFDEKERGLWLTLVTLSQILGSLLCSLIPITFVDLGEGVPKETSRKQIWMTFLGEFIAVVIVALLTFAFFGEGTTRNSILRQEKYQRYKVKMLAQGLVPKKYKKGARGTQSVWIQIKHIMSRPYLIAVVLINALTYGMVVGSGALGTPILTSVGYEQVYGGITGIVSILVGTASLFIYGSFFIKKSNQYTYLLWALIMTTVFSFSIYFAFRYSIDIIWVIVLYGLVGAAIFPILTIILEEMLSRLNASYLVLISIVLSFLHQLVSFIYVSVCGSAFNGKDKQTTLDYLLYSYIIYVLVIGIYFLSLYLSKIDNQRPSVARRFKIRNDVVKGNKGMEEEEEQVMQEEEKTQDNRNRVVEPERDVEGLDDYRKGFDEIIED